VRCDNIVVSALWPAGELFLLGRPGILGMLGLMDISGRRTLLVKGFDIIRVMRDTSAAVTFLFLS
jgi:hypothetical protein